MKWLTLNKRKLALKNSQKPLENIHASKVDDCSALSPRVPLKENQERIDEAEKLRKMNAEEKAKYEVEKQADYIAELVQNQSQWSLKEASKMLSEAGIVATDEILTLSSHMLRMPQKLRQQLLAALVWPPVDKKVSEMLKGKTPKKVGAINHWCTTKEQFDRMGYKDRNELPKQPELYAQLKG